MPHDIVGRHRAMIVGDCPVAQQDHLAIDCRQSPPLPISQVNITCSAVVADGSFREMWLGREKLFEGLIECEAPGEGCVSIIAWMPAFRHGTKNEQRLLASGLGREDIGPTYRGPNRPASQLALDKVDL